MRTRRVLLCPPVMSASRSGCYPRRCADCPERVWVGVELRGQVMAGEFEPMCLPCARCMVAHSGLSVLGLMPDQVDRVRRLGFEVTEVADSPALTGGTRVVLRYLELLEQYWRLRGMMAWR